MKPFKGNDAYTSFFIVGIGTFCFVFLILISLVKFVVKWWLYSSINSISILLICFGILASIFYALSSLFTGLVWLFYTDVIVNELFGNICAIIQILFWHLGQLMVYCYLLKRLHMGFRDTVHEISWRILVFLSILLCCYLLGCLIILEITIHYLKLYSLNSAKTIDNIPNVNELQITYKAITLIVDFILSIALLGIFVDRLNKISKNLAILIDNDYDLMSHESSITDSLSVRDTKTLQTQNENIFNVMSKVLILGVIMIVSSQISLILSLTNWIINSDTNNALTVVYSWSKGLHTFIASLSIFLGFEFTHNWYIFCCGLCHKKTSNVIRKNNDITQSLQRYNKK